jgi:hypothetical protein
MLFHFMFADILLVREIKRTPSEVPVKGESSTIFKSKK